ncbi:MAG: hypothetical protein LBC67_04590 [Spirochaetales bacterium]|nr:hypothetical protein [Spirochaetales bacterium]
MEIYVNGNAVSFSLEKEASFFDVYQSLALWAGSEGAEITDIRLNGAAMDPGCRDEWKSISLDVIQKIELGLTAPKEKIQGELSVILDYFSLLDRALSSGSDEETALILKEYPYIHESMRLHLKDIFPAGTMEDAAPDAFIMRAAAEAKPFTGAQKGMAREFLRMASLVIQGRLAEIADPSGEAQAAARLLLAARPGLENVPVLLQSGRDREAMQAVLSFTELALKAMRILPRVNEGRDGLTAFCGELNGVLTELTGAFEARDSVLIGDLLEYEVAPRTDRLAELLKGGD